METILNLCGGKIIPEITENQFLVNLDLSYKFGADSIDAVRLMHRNYNQQVTSICGRSGTYFIIYGRSGTYFINHDVYDFLENYDVPFDKIIIYRFLEHVPKSKLLYFIYLDVKSFIIYMI